MFHSSPEDLVRSTERPIISPVGFERIHEEFD
jgi:hypothetical protein